MFYSKDFREKKERKTCLNKGLTSLAKVSFHLTLCPAHDRDLTSGECHFGSSFSLHTLGPLKSLLKI